MCLTLRSYFYSYSLGCLQHISNLVEVENILTGLWTQQNPETFLPLQKQTRGFFTPRLFFRFCAQLCSHHTFSLHTIQPNFTAQKTHRRVLEKSYSFLFYCGNFQSLSDSEHFVANLFHCCFSGQEKCRYQGCSKSTFSLLQNRHITLQPSVQKQHKWQYHD